MKNLIILIFSLLLLNSCNDLENKTKITEMSQTINGFPLKIIEIDSCEYVYFSNGNASWGSHKGNCIYCLQRNKNIKQ